MKDNFKNIMVNIKDLLNENLMSIILILLFLVGLFLFFLYISQRIESVDMLPRNCNGMVLSGIVTYVSDGDTFKFYHTPMFRFNNIKKNNKTLSIRLYGIDAPELSHFGKPEQPLAKEAKKALSDLILLKKIKIKILAVDRYSRVIAIAYKGFFRKINISHKMVEMGMACVYEGRDSIYDGKENILRELESEAMSKKIGIWGLPNYESPMSFKKRIKK